MGRILGQESCSTCNTLFLSQYEYQRLSETRKVRRARAKLESIVALCVDFVQCGDLKKAAGKWRHFEVAIAKFGQNS